jgi:hypothetical protein
MNRNLLLSALVAIGLLLAATVPFLPVLTDFDAVAAFNDGNIESVLSPSSTYPDILLRCWNNQFFFGQAVGTIALSTQSLFESVLGPDGFRRSGVVLSIWFAGMAAYGACRKTGRSRGASWVAALLTALCGWTYTFPLAGLPSRTFALAWSLLALGFLKGARDRRSWLQALLAGGCLGLAVSDSPDVGLIFSVAVGLYAGLILFIDRAAWKPAAFLRRALMLAVVVLASVFTAWQTVSTMFQTNIEGVSQGAREDSASRYDWATQWSLPVEETWSLIAADHHGASSRSGDDPYWGRMGRSAGWKETREGYRNFRLAGYAVGSAAGVLALMGISFLAFPTPRRRWEREARLHAGILLALMAVCLMLSWGRHFPLYRLFYELPLMSTIRNPDKWLGPFMLFLVPWIAWTVDGLLRFESDGKRPARWRSFATWLAVPGLIPIVSALVLLSLHFGRRGMMSTLRSEGFDARTAAAAWHNAVQANGFALVIGGAVLGLIAWKLAGRRWGRWSGAVLIAGLSLGLCVELLPAIRPYVMKHHYKRGVAPNVLTQVLGEQQGTGYAKLIPAQHPLMNNWRFSMLKATGFDLFDPVSVSRMPKDYQAFSEALAGNPARFWQLGSVRWFIAFRETVPELRRMLNGPLKERLSFGAVRIGAHIVPSAEVPERQKNLAVVEYAGALPLHSVIPSWTSVSNRTSLSRLADPSFDPAREALVSPALESGTGSTGTVEVLEHSSVRSRLRVRTEAGGLLLRNVQYHPDWTVRIDGEPRRLTRANYLFQGVRLPGGEREVLFSYEPSMSGLWISIAARVAMAGWFALWVMRRQEPGGV